MNYIVMALLVLFSLHSSAADLDVTPIVSKIETLKQNKKTSPVVDYNVFDPFAKAKPLLAQQKQHPITKKRVRPIVVQTILNRRALIDGKWYSKGDRIEGSTIIALKQHHIVVAKGDKTVTIPLKTGKRIITTKEPSR